MTTKKSTLDRSRGGPASEPEDTGAAGAVDRSMSIADIRAAHRDLADTYDRFDWIDRLALGRARRRQFGDVDGRVLDVACGTGPNFRYLPSTAEVVGVDVSPEMLAKARDRLATLAVDGTVREMDAQDLAFEDDSFDAVISSLSTCTIPDPVAALREMDRVCKPQGTIRLLEHGRSSVGPIAALQEWRADAHFEHSGCRWTQEPLDHVAAAGLTPTAVRTGWLGMLTAIELRPSE